MSNVVVVDANLALKWVLIEEDSPQSIGLLEKWKIEGKKVIAPALFAYEVTNIIHRQAVTGKLTHDEALQGLSKLFSLGIALKFSTYVEISKQAIKYAHRFHLSATYDSHYLALASREKCEFWTADTRLWNVVKSELTWVHLLSDSESL
jgi:predicted nucleic acid-binding protein